MTGDKHRSLKSLFRSKLPRPAKLPDHQEAYGSHRSFLRRRNSKSSITPQSSTSLLRSLGMSNSTSEFGTISLAGRSGSRQSDSESSHLVSLVVHHDDKRKKDKKKRNGSHQLLKRFFKILRPHDHGDRQELLPLRLSQTSKLATKYDVGRLIGLGASGLVNLVTDNHDALQIYAVKKFRPKLKNESDRDYVTKVKNEYLVGDYLHHQNLIHTIELVKDILSTGLTEFYIVMEYCPFDFFNLVMSGLMTKEEIYCYTKQITLGVQHLHSAGVAHRDLKLDNCVVDSNGVLKLIDFGSAVQFRKLKDSSPTDSDVMLDDEHKLVFAKGIVGSDPYLSPEVFQSKTDGGYDPRLADVWSIAIIFCCMILKRFPWKVPRESDPSYRSFAGISAKDDSPGDAEKLAHAASELSLNKEQQLKTGPYRLLRLLPSKARPLVRGMLEIDCTKRWFIDDVVADPFFQSIEYCHYVQEDELSTVEPLVTDGSEAHVSAASALNQGVTHPVHVEPAHEALADLSETGSEFHDAPTRVQEKIADLDGRSATPDSSASATTEVAVNPPVKEVGALLAATNHTHHLVTEKELETINADRERARKMKENGMA